MPKVKKILVKVVRDDSLKWVHFCRVSTEVYDEFFKVTECSTADFGAFLSVWAKNDFGVRLTMATFEDIRYLKTLVKRRFQIEYCDLYALPGAESLSIRGWFQIWVSQHMKEEISERKSVGNENSNT